MPLGRILSVSCVGPIPNKARMEPEPGEFSDTAELRQLGQLADFLASTNLCATLHKLNMCPHTHKLLQQCKSSMPGTQPGVGQAHGARRLQTALHNPIYYPDIRSGVLSG